MDDEILIHFLLSVLPCPGDWRKREEFCYLHVEEKKTWQEASSICTSKGGHLISIQSDDENEYIYSKYLLISLFYNFNFSFGIIFLPPTLFVGTTRLYFFTFFMIC